MRSQFTIVSSAVFLLAALSLTPAFSHAAPEIGVYDTDVSVETIPANPEPYGDVTVKLTSYATDLSKADIAWRSGSALLQSGFGKTSYSFKALGPNTPVAIDITITPDGSGGKVTKRVIINPSEIDILWEAVDGYTPPFYKGKSFASTEGTIKAVAFAQTKTGNKSNLTYTWKSGSTTLLGSSGYGKDSYSFKNSEFVTNERVSVSASTVDSSYSAAKTVDIPIINPKIVFYKKSPTEGIFYNQAVANESIISEDEITLIAEPYFLAWKGNEDDFTYSWQINGQSIATPSRKTELTVRPSARGGYATIAVILENLNSLYQTVTGQLRINL
ncbi:MAG: hypothetical protein V4665_02420 [Patescibacteria group bacterium]